ncbi:hypothetical protein BKA70DRAFT_1437583 [Coprinopsis sp. MPI-PUGE-AT-0042]|nr:hypothetical protein BKA70DRAFT_1437583 [Coprinopsis sp. MPI-PUGE-AT-0042]
MDTSQFVDPPYPPPPPTFQGAMLVNDAAHPYMEPKEGDIRLTSAIVVTSRWRCFAFADDHRCQEGFNMETNLARTTTYAAHLLDGNPLTDLISIGHKTPKTGPDPPAPAIIHSGEKITPSNQTLFDEFKCSARSTEMGSSTKPSPASFATTESNNLSCTIPTLPCSASATTQPTLKLLPRPILCDGRKTGAEAGQLDMATAERFFKDMHFPDDFHRPAKPVDTTAIAAIYAAHPTEPGRNVNGVNTFEVDHSQGSITDPCAFYQQFVLIKVHGLYPNPTGMLKRNLNKNLQFFYDTIGG